MESNHFFQGGLHKDADEQYQPKDTYRDAEGWVLTPAGHLEQERGLLPIQGPGGLLVGGTVLNGQEILFSTTLASSQVGVLDGGAYTSIITLPFPMGSTVRATARVDYRGHRLVYWADGTSLRTLDLDNPTTDIPKGLELIPNPNSPTVSLSNVDSGGSLSTGVYFATACLLTASKNTTSYGLFTGSIPVLNEDPNTSPRQLLDGAPPQTPASGSITFTLANLDPSYSYVQLVVGSYVGLSNQLTLYKLAPISLNGRSSLDYTYYSSDQHEGLVTLDEVIQVLPDYVGATEVIQKDNHLLLANLTTAPQEAIDWQAVANSIVLGPAIREVRVQEDVHVTHFVEGQEAPSVDDAPFSASKEDYKKPALTETGKSFQRGEVYAFSFTPIVNGRKLDAYHIPAPFVGGTGGFAPFLSAEEYPRNQGHVPGIGQDWRIRHHRMPTLQEQPLTYLEGNQTVLRILGIQEIAKPDFSALTLSQQGAVTGYLIGMQERKQADKSILAQGIASPLQVAPNNRAFYVTPFAGQAGYGGANYDGSVDRNSTEYQAFYSPETILLQADLQQATRATPVAKLTGTSYGVADTRTGGLGEEQAAVFLNYTDAVYNELGSVPLAPPLTSRVRPGTEETAFQTGERFPLFLTNQNSYTLLKANDPVGAGFTKDTLPDIRYLWGGGTRTSLLLFRQADGSFPNQDDAKYTGITHRLLYNVCVDRPRPYGSLEQATYFPIGQSTPDGDKLVLYKGDTFIGKFAVVSKTQELTDEEPGLRFATLSYFWCESTANVNYRHFLPATGDALGTLPYYPKQRTLWAKDGSGILQYPSSLGHADGYNKQYSKNPLLIPLSPKDYSLDTVTRFTNRILYSAQAVEGEQLDAFRSFSANNYHDLPKDKGPITSLYQNNGSLFAHTSGATYKCFFNEATTQATSEGEVTLGNGGLFPRPSVPIFTLEGGYAGCASPTACISTPVGHFFCDQLTKKVFLQGEGLREISKDGGLYTYLQGAIGGGTYRASYDYAGERFILGGTGFRTLSWSARSQKWASFHAYTPLFTLSSTQRLLMQAGTTLGVVNQGPIQTSTLTLVTNEQPDASKLFGAVQLQSRNLPKQLLCGTQSQDSSLTNISPYTAYGQDPKENEVLYRLVNDQWQFAFPRDLEGGKLKGKWLQHTYQFAAETVPALVKQLTVLLTARYR